MTSAPFSARRAALGGLLATASGLGIGELVAGVLGAGAPIRRVGDRVVDGAPHRLKTFAIEQFGTNDKAVLLGTIVVILALGALAVGRVAARRFVRAAIAVAVVSAIGIAFALSGRLPESIDIFPIVAAGATTIGALWLLVGKHTGAVDPAPGPIDALPTGSAVSMVDRRQFVVMGSAAAGVAAISTAIGRRLQGDPEAVAVRATLTVPKANETLGPVNPKATADVVGMTPWQTPTEKFYRIDTALVVPRINAEKWKMTISGRVKKPMTLTYNDLLSRPLIEHDCTLMCVSNEIGGELIGNARWTGIRLADVLREAEVETIGSDQLFVTSTDGFTAGFPTKAAMDGREALIAVAMNGEPLPFKHGFPARLVIPGIYGYVSAVKWLSSIEVTTFDEKQGYWIPRGWSALGPIKTGSRIDVVGFNNQPVAGKNAIAGVAWDQHTGVAKVEVQIDDEPWREAILAADGGIDTWRQWKIEWNAERGSHIIRVRATNAKGKTQPEERTEVAPDGATGWHTVNVNV